MKVLAEERETVKRALLTVRPESPPSRSGYLRYFEGGPVFNPQKLLNSGVVSLGRASTKIGP
jgi:hypothetical protein